MAISTGQPRRQLASHVVSTVPTPDLVALVMELRERVATLEARYGPRDDAEAAVLPVIAASSTVGGRPFTSQMLLAYTDDDPDLAAALEAADVETVRECGKMLARLEGRSIGGLRLVRVGSNRSGVIWSVQVSNSQTRTA